MNKTRPLTHDEKKAAEAAYRGRAFDASWSQSARAVYDGILTARGHAVDVFDSGRVDQEAVQEGESPETDVFAETMDPALLSDEKGESGVGQGPSCSFSPGSHQGGMLVDVTKKAQRIGFHVAVGITEVLVGSEHHEVPGSRPA